MRILLDTHVWLWWILEPHKVGARSRRLLASPANEVCLSAVSSWEVSIKAALGILKLPAEPRVFLEQSLNLDGFVGLPITPAHTVGVYDLPGLHKDPFDRLLVAQASAEGIPLMTCDPMIRQYAVSTLDASS